MAFFLFHVNLSHILLREPFASVRMQTDYDLARIVLPLPGHRMNGSGVWFILWPCFCGFRPIYGHRMDRKADSFILWPEEPDERAGMSKTDKFSFISENI